MTMEFAEKLQRLRKAKGLSQEGLADLLGVSRQSVSKWENGQAYPETDKIIALSELFGVTIDSLLKDGPEQPDEGNRFSEPFWMGRGRFYEYEYKSKRTLFGLPLVHVNIGIGHGKRHTARGIIAIGNVARGVIAVGLLAMGLVSFGVVGLGAIGIGCLGVGLAAVGSVAVGGLAIGAVAIGLFAIGAVALGMFSTGAVAVASHIALGDHAYGHVAIGKAAEGAFTFLDTTPWNSFQGRTIDGTAVRAAIEAEFPWIWGWITDFFTSMLG